MEGTYRQIPYGITDFERIRKENYYYVDKTRFIRKVEEAGTFLFLLRPRRFGKSLFANMLAAYYDVKMADRYDDIFRGLEIYDKPTAERNKYMVMKFNFSAVDPDPEKVNDSFNTNVLIQLREFVKKYAEFLPAEAKDVVATATNSNDAFAALMSLVRWSDYRIYLIVDEYDNFANTLLSYDEAGYKKLTHGTGFFRLFFNSLKAATTDNQAVIQRLFITGVTPLCLSDVTSGFNIGRNLSMDYEFNESMGFSEQEVRTMLEYYRDARGTFQHSIDEIVETIKPWYNNSCFAEKSIPDDRLFNSDMVLYFLNCYVPHGFYPESFIDMNVASDMEKTRKMLSYDRRNDEKSRIIEQILDQGYIDRAIPQAFRLEDLGKKDSLVGLLYYLGLLSWGRTERGFICPVITNQVVLEQYYTYMSRYYQEKSEWRIDSDEINDLGRMAAREGDMLPLLEYLCGQMNEQTAARDFNRDGEAFVKGYLLALLGNNNGCFVCTSESPLHHGYVDIMLRPMADFNEAFLIELKYCKPNSADSIVEQLYADARTQLADYAQSHALAIEAHSRGWRLHRIALVVRGWELERLEEV